MATGPIPSTAISDWVDRECYDDQDAADFRRCIRAMDAEFLGVTKAPITEDGMSEMLFSLAKR